MVDFISLTVIIIWSQNTLKIHMQKTVERTEKYD